MARGWDVLIQIFIFLSNNFKICLNVNRKSFYLLKIFGLNASFFRFCFHLDTMTLFLNNFLFIFIAFLDIFHNGITVLHLNFILGF